jgi:hypothetical protein
MRGQRLELTATRPCSAARPTAKASALDARRIATSTQGGARSAADAGYASSLHLWVCFKNIASDGSQPVPNAHLAGCVHVCLAGTRIVLGRHAEA